MSLRTVFVVALVGIVWSCVLGLQRPPPRYSQQYMPETAFNCRNKIVGSYYADPETDCQLFHVCVSVAGSVQDYKFLCPNDTAFDQESQTCADWYDVDCEAATLYYASDNFDLYRLGSGLESVHYDDRRSDAEPQDHLQRSETSDPVRSAANNLNRVTPSAGNSNSNSNSNSRDILRGSSSINFYNSKNGGKDEDYESEKSYEPVQEPRKKNGVRKIARNQQQNTNNNANNINLGNNYAASSTAAPLVAISQNVNDNNHYNNNNGNFRKNNNNNNNNNGNFYKTGNDNHVSNRQRSSTSPSTIAPSTVAPEIYNARNQNNHKYNAPVSTYRPSTAQQSYSTYQSPGTTSRTTVYNNAYNTNQQTSNSYGQSINTSPKTTSYSQNYPSVAVTTLRPTSYSQNYPDYSQFGQNARTQSTTVQPSTNYQSSDYTNFQRNYNNIQRSTGSSANTFPSTTAASTFFDNYNTNGGRTNAEQFNKVSGQVSTRQQVATQTTKYFPNYAGSSYVPSTHSPATKKGVTESGSSAQNGARNDERYNTQSGNNGPFYDSTRAPKKTSNNDNGQSQGRGVDRYTSQSTGNENLPYTGQQQSAKSTVYYDSTRAPKKVTQYNSNYDITNNGRYYETSTASNDAGRAQGGIGFSPSSINHLAETPRSTTPVPKRTGAPTTYNPNTFNANNQRKTQTTQSGTTFVSGSARPFSTTAKYTDATTPRPKSAKKNDYDYAYYDNVGGFEYDGVDLEHVVAGNKESSKISRN